MNRWLPKVYYIPIARWPNWSMERPPLGFPVHWSHYFNPCRRAWPLLRVRPREDDESFAEQEERLAALFGNADDDDDWNDGETGDVEPPVSDDQLELPFENDSGDHARRTGGRKSEWEFPRPEFSA